MGKIILILKYIVVALIQGIAEILPISSSGHMLVAQKVLGLDSSELTFEVFLHFASLIAIVFFFRKKLWAIIKDFLIYITKHKQIENDLLNEETKENALAIKINFKLGLYIIIATIPAAIGGLLLEDAIAKYFTQIWIVGICLLITGTMILISSKISRDKDYTNMTYKNALIIGLFQFIGLFPGISRSGSCLTGAASQKIKQNEAAHFAFLLAIPIMLGSAIIKVKDISSALSDSSLFIPYIIAFIVALFTTYIAIQFFLKVIRKQKLSVFAYYCFFAGVSFIILDLFI